MAPSSKIFALLITVGMVAALPRTDPNTGALEIVRKDKYIATTGTAVWTLSPDGTENLWYGFLQAVIFRLSNWK